MTDDPRQTLSRLHDDGLLADAELTQALAACDAGLPDTATLLVTQLGWDADRAREVIAGLSGETVVDAPTRPTRPEVSVVVRDGQLVQLGRYQIGRLLGAGGMGQVYAAHDPLLGREVALKTMTAHGEPEAVQRFLREARATAGLDHPHIIKVHDIGQTGDACYFAMDLVRGRTMQQALADGLPRRDGLTLLARVARAVDHAHQHKIVHRDLKPANIMLDEAGEPRVMDFGLARQIDQSDRVSRSGMILGTVAYMPPEQARGEHDRIDARSDVYALGAVLYELLTGEPPFTGQTVHMLLTWVIERDPVPPRHLDPQIPADLETICLKCLEKEPERRYESARALAADLERYLDDRPIVARQAGLLYRLRKWVRRNRVLTASLATIFTLLLTFIGLLRVQVREARTARAAAEDGTRKATHSRRLAEQREQEAERLKGLAVDQQKELARRERAAWDSLVASLRERAAMAWEAGQHERASLLLATLIARGGERLPTAELRQARYQLAMCMAERCREQQRVPWTRRVLELPLSEARALDAGRLTEAARAVFAAARRRTGRQTRAVVVEPDRRWMVIQMGGPSMLIQREARALGGYVPSEHGLISPDGRTMALIYGVRIELTELGTGRRLTTLTPGWRSEILTLVFDRAGKRLAAGGRSGHVTVWDTGSGKPLFEARVCDSLDHGHALAFGAQGRRLAVAGGGAWTTIIVDVDRKAELISMKGPGWADGVAMNATGDLIATTYKNGAMSLWSLRLKKAMQLTYERGRASSLALSTDGYWLYLADGRALRTWDLDRRKIADVQYPTVGRIVALAMSPDGRFLAVGSDMGEVYVEHLETRSVSRLPGAGGPVTRLSFSLAGALCVVSQHGGIQLWEPSDGRLERRLRRRFPLEHKEFTNEVYGVAWSADGQRVYGAYKLGRTVEWPVAFGAPVRTFGRRLRQHQRVAVSPDDRWVAVSSHAPPPKLRQKGDVAGPLLQLYDRASGTLRHALAGIAPGHLRFSPDSRLLLASVARGLVRIDVASGARTDIALERPHVALDGLSPDGRWLAYATPDHAIRIAATDGGTPRTLATLDSPTSDLRFSADGTRLRVATSSMTLLTLGLTDGQVTARVPLQRAHPGERQWPVLDPTGRLAVARAYGGLTVWDGRTGVRIRTLGGHDRAGLGRPVFDPTGQRVMARSLQRVFVWNLATRDELLTLHHGKLLAEVERRLGYRLGPQLELLPTR